MNRILKLFIVFLLLGAYGFAGEGKAQTRELPPLTAHGDEKLFYANMERIKIPSQEQEGEVRDVLSWMGVWDRKQTGGSINRDMDFGNWTPKNKVRLAKKEYTYRTMLDEVCQQADIYWWVEDDPWIGVIVGPKSVYLEHRKKLADKPSRRVKTNETR